MARQRAESKLGEREKVDLVRKASEIQKETQEVKTFQRRVSGFSVMEYEIPLTINLNNPFGSYEFQMSLIKGSRVLNVTLQGRPRLWALVPVGVVEVVERQFVLVENNGPLNYENFKHRMTIFLPKPVHLFEIGR